MIMPFGKYKGQQVEDIPDGYLRWALENCNLTADLQKEMEDQLGAREGQGIVRDKSILDRTREGEE
jgi:hypothetical protein